MVWSHEQNIYICASTWYVSVNLGRVMTLAEGLPLTKLYVSLVVWLLDVTCHYKNVCLHLHKTYEDQTWTVVTMVYGHPNNKVV